MLTKGSSIPAGAVCSSLPLAVREDKNINLKNIAVHLAGVAMFAVPASILVLTFDRFSSPRFKEMVTPLFALMSLAFSGIPGIYVAIKGPLVGEAGTVNRRKAVVSVIVGLGIIVGGIIINIVINLIALSAGYVCLAFGVLGIGLVSCSIGLASLVSGRDLYMEMSNIRLRDTSRENLHIDCPQCGRLLKGATREMIGDTGVCPKCKAEFTLRE